MSVTCLVPRFDARSLAGSGTAATFSFPSSQPLLAPGPPPGRRRAHRRLQISNANISHQPPPLDLYTCILAIEAPLTLDSWRVETAPELRTARYTYGVFHCLTMMNAVRSLAARPSPRLLKLHLLRCPVAAIVVGRISFTTKTDERRETYR